MVPFLGGQPARLSGGVPYLLDDFLNDKNVRSWEHLCFFPLGHLEPTVKTM